MFMIGGLGICYVCAQWFGEPSQAQRDSLLRSMFQFANLAAIFVAAGTILGMYWAKANWGRYWAWDPKETCAFLILGCAVLISGLQWIKPAQRIAVLIGILGNVITAWGWFGANAPSQSVFANPLLFAFICSQFLFLLGGAVNSFAEIRRAQEQR